MSTREREKTSALTRPPPTIVQTARNEHVAVWKRGRGVPPARSVEAGRRREISRARVVDLRTGKRRSRERKGREATHNEHAPIGERRR